MRVFENNSMNKTSVTLPSIMLVGITGGRTSLVKEMNPSSAIIPPTLGRYFKLAAELAQIKQRTTPGVTYCVYTDYESNEHGEYTYFVGEQVESFDNIPTGFDTLTIPAQHYAKFTTDAGQMPKVCIDAWKAIWSMTPEQLGGKRNYQADFELYDNRAADPSNTVLDVYIGITR